MRTNIYVLSLLVMGVFLLSPTIGIGKDIGIGVIYSLTGQHAQYGMQNLAGTQLALEKINAGGGISGRKIKLNIQDDAGSKTQSVSAFRKLAADPEILAVLGVQATVCLVAVASVAGELKLLVLSAGSAGTWKGEYNEYTFRCTTPVMKLAGGAARKLIPLLGIKSAAIIYEIDNEAMVTEAEEVRKVLSEMGVKVVLNEAHRMADTDFSPYVTKITNTNPDIVFTMNVTNAAGLSTLQLRERGYKGAQCGGIGWTDLKIWDLSRGKAEGTYMQNPYSSYSEKAQNQEFLKLFKEKYGEKQVPSSYNAMGYDAMLLTADALKRANKLTRRDVRDALGSTKGFEGAVCPYNYDGKGDNTTPGMVLVQMKNRDFIPVNLK